MTAMDPRTSITRIGQLGINAHDLPRTMHFYQKALGLQLQFQMPQIQNAWTAMTGRGVRFEAPPHQVHKVQDHELWLAFFRDSEGNLLALMSEVR